MCTPVPEAVHVPLEQWVKLETSFAVNHQHMTRVPNLLTRNDRVRLELSAICNRRRAAKSLFLSSLANHVLQTRS